MSARATLEQLKQRHGFEEVSEDFARVRSMGEVELWRRVSGRGLKSIFEKYVAGPEGALEGNVDEGFNRHS